jgi:hypothetical protein
MVMIFLDIRSDLIPILLNMVDAKPTGYASSRVGAQLGGDLKSADGYDFS